MKQIKFTDSTENVRKNEAKIILKKCETKEIPQPPDGGWGWMVIIGTILVMITSQMVVPSFGIMFSTMLSTLKVSSTTVSWIFNTHGVMWNISKLMAGPLSDVLSWRPVAMLGAFLVTVSIIISAFATSAAFLFFSFSILGGLGAGLTTSICFFIIPNYFKKYRSQAMSIMLVGSCCGFTFASSLVGHFACMTLVGFGFGMIVSLYPLVIIDIMGMPLYTQTFGFTSLFNGFFCVTTGPLIGFARDYSGSYPASIRTIAGTMLAAFILWLCMPIAVKYDSKKSKGDTETTA